MNRVALSLLLALSMPVHAARGADPPSAEVIDPWVQARLRDALALLGERVPARLLVGEPEPLPVAVRWGALVDDTCALGEPPGEGGACARVEVVAPGPQDTGFALVLDAGAGLIAAEAVRPGAPFALTVGFPPGQAQPSVVFARRGLLDPLPNVHRAADLGVWRELARTMVALGPWLEPGATPWVTLAPDPPPPSALLADAVAPGEVLLVYGLDGDALSARAWDPAAGRLLDGPPASRAAVEASLDAMYASLGRSPTRGRRASARRGAVAEAVGGPGVDFAGAAAALSAALLPGELGALVSGASHVLVVPAGPVGAVPWLALDPEGDGSPLAERSRVTVLPSLVALPSRGPARVDPRGAAVVVGDPPARAARGLGPLPGARAEALALAGAWEVPALVGRDATEAAVLERAWAARVLHLATHGVVDPADPLDGSFIHLADGGWTAREIQGARLDALELVVLSACQTARGRELEGGTVGLARAFWLAGADQVVASLWSVDDAATASLMLRLAAHLPEASPGEALRRAVVEQRRESPDPAHWAGFVVFGAPDAPPP